ncbi:phosphatidylserine decarboxylase family protein [Natronogracilivirga saccharolytica]|uniref:Phosphatidylserine decarboxylase proenzyme n=1 Tax=Natronogracilivirga saccharolytica TaxID=2812953 RepID=A0A8J7RMF8_9BACT|nr:phosphatidylserine decarboxylase family protein [Natronogracilivirga saccharolytica]MBP3192424.1 phosphatidylserine decarboxylase family protein [Natronogracilivirga saccharolytica]
MRFAKDGVPVIVAVLFLSLIIIAIGWILNNAFSILLYLAGVGLSGFTLFFFRDPERSIPEGDFVLAPADGKVISVDDVREDTYLGRSARQITIFLSLGDVHVNRYPVSGKVEHVSYHPGKYLVAWHPKASELNERAEFGIRHPSGVPIFYRQITGFVARRIVFHTKEGDEVSAGDRFGIMKFGSRMDILVPDDMEVLVSEGDRTRGGETILGRL